MHTGVIGERDRLRAEGDGIVGRALHGVQEHPARGGAELRTRRAFVQPALFVYDAAAKGDDPLAEVRR
jgi:hypothetical protein